MSVYAFHRSCGPSAAWGFGSQGSQLSMWVLVKMRVPFWVRCRMKIRTPKGTIILTTTHVTCGTRTLRLRLQALRNVVYMQLGFRVKGSGSQTAKHSTTARNYLLEIRSPEATLRQRYRPRPCLWFASSGSGKSAQDIGSFGRNRK